MLRTDQLLGDYEMAVTVYKWPSGQLLRLADRDGGAGLVYVPAEPDRARRELEMMSALKYAGIPECRRTIESGSGTTALVLHGADDARPLAVVHELPEPTLRAGLTSLLQTVNFAHSRGIVHRRIDRSVVLVDPAGRFWLTGWADATAVSSAPPTTSTLSEAATDLRDLARAFREALLRRPWPDPAGTAIHERGPRTAAGQELIDAGVKVDRDFARVLSRLVTADPRDAYTGATDVLADLSAVDATAFDPWESIRPIGTRREVARVLRLLDQTRIATSPTVSHAASVDYVAPDGAGKSRLLAEVARVARAKNVIVLTAEGGARGTWGGVGALARQLVQLLGRDSRMCVQHADALRHLLGERDEERRDPLSNGSPHGGSRDPQIAACTAAVTDLVRSAFRQTPGLLLLDDEENLSVAARQVWRSTGEFIQSINGGGGVLCALLVSTSTLSRPAEVGANRVVVELRPWRQRDVEKFLARAFAAPGGARDASAAIHPLTGGRPGDVVGYVRELERQGALCREGLRWRLTVAVSALPPHAGGVAEQVRRALACCGRDTVTLVECLAVAREVSLSRTAVEDLSDVRGPRLAAAADAGVATGLLVVDGSGWRVRTDAVAHRVCAAIPDDRRRVLHREILNILLDTAPDGLDAIATHARASRDPRAERWTRDAIERAQAEGEWGRALRHLDDAAALIGGSFAGLEAELDRAELLASLGRVGEVIETLRQRRADEYASIETCLHSLLLLARAHYEAREWQPLLDLAMPETFEAPAKVAELRFIRAAAMRHLGRVQLAARESRLGAAETADAEPPRVMLARLEYEYQAGLYSLDWPTARAALVTKLRVGRRLRDQRQVIIDLTKLGNAARYLARDMRLSHAILVRAVGVSRLAPSVGGAAKSALYGTLGYICAYTGMVQRGHRHFGRSTFFAVQSGSTSLMLTTRLRLIWCAVASGRATYDDKRFVQFTVSGMDDLPDSTIASACCELVTSLLYYGFQSDAERVAERVRAILPSYDVTRVVEGYASIGRMWLDEDPASVVPEVLPESVPRDLIKACYSAQVGEMCVASIAYCALRPEYQGDDWLDRVISHGIARRFTRTAGFPGWGTAALAMSLALWIPIQHDPEVWKQLLTIARRHKGPLPVALEWQRVLMESRELRRAGDWNGSEALREVAEAQLDLLLGEEFGERGAKAHARWSRRLRGGSAAAAGAVDAGTGASATQRDDGSAARAPALEAASLLPESWNAVRQSVVDPSATVAVVVTSPYLRELQLFGEAVRERSGGRIVVWSDGPNGAALRFDSRYPLVLVGPNLWPSERLKAAHEALANKSTAPKRVVSLLTVPLSVFRTEGPYQRSLSERMDGRLQQLEAVLGVPARRGPTFVSLVASRSDSVKVDDAALAELIRYDWPGGLAEMERLVESLLARQASPLTMETLNDTGWRMRVAARDDGLLEEERELLRELSACPCAGISQLAAAVGRPRRTVLRYLNRLVESGTIVRTGRGRATLYRTRAAATARRI